MRSGVNWTRANFQRKAAASALTRSVLARPGTPTSRACEPVKAQVRSRSMVASCPTTTWCSPWRIARTRSAKVSTCRWAIAAGSSCSVMGSGPFDSNESTGRAVRCSSTVFDRESVRNRFRGFRGESRRVTVTSNDPFQHRSRRSEPRSIAVRHPEERAMSDATSEFAELLAKARSGDEAALTRLAERYEPKVRVVARVLLGPALRPYLDSVDLVQSVHRSVVVGLRVGKFDLSAPGDLIALAVAMLRRKVARHWRHLRKQQRPSVADG